MIWADAGVVVHTVFWLSNLHGEAPEHRMRAKVGQPFARGLQDTFSRAVATQETERLDLVLLRRDNGEHPVVVGAGWKKILSRVGGAFYSHS